MSRHAAEGTAPGAPRWRVVTLVVMAIAAAGVLVALVLTLNGANRERDRALAAQQHSYDVMILGRALGASIARAEASLGRYVISGDQALGRLYVQDWEVAGAQLDRLDRITGDDQQARIDALRLAFLQRGEELDLTALATRYGRNDQALARFYHARQAPALVAIDRALDRLTDRERELLEARTAAAGASIGRSSALAGSLTGFGILLVMGMVALGWITVRMLGEAAVAEAEAAAASERAAELTAAVATATDELRQQEARLRQVQKMEAVGQLTGGIAHDFNNMLAVVTGGLELAGRTLLTNPVATRRHLDSAAEGAARAAALTRRLLAFSREEQLKPETTRPGALVAGMRDLLDRTLGDGVTVQLADRAGDWCVRADKVQLENAVLNLAVNARDAMDGRGELGIATAARTLAADEVAGCAPGDHVALAVTDTGCGMAPDVAERVFEPFFTTKGPGKGTGLGLSQIFALAQGSGGGIAIRSAPGEGSTVTLFLPRDTAGEAAAPRAEPAVATGSRTVAATVLVVEDDPRVLATTVAALVELGHRALPCADPLLASAVLDAAGDVALIVSDVLMPRQTGPEMIAALPPRWAGLPVLFVTGFAGEVAPATFGDAPVLRKPFTLAGLATALATLLPADDASEAIAAE